MRAKYTEDLFSWRILMWFNLNVASRKVRYPEEEKKTSKFYFYFLFWTWQSRFSLTVKSRKGISRVVVDTSYLGCDHHVFMGVGVSMALKAKVKGGQVLVIGLGGGGLCTYLHNCFKEVQSLYPWIFSIFVVIVLRRTNGISSIRQLLRQLTLILLWRK